MEGAADTQPQERQSLGDFIASQRRAAEMSLRQLAERAGISNPYVSQIERGLRRPSAEVLAQLAQALKVSAESLYERAGLLDPDEVRPTSLERAIRDDPILTDAQKQALLEVYRAFRATRDEPGEPTPPTIRTSETDQPEAPAHHKE